mmetsp:Transcript_41868/g.87501  ORF Transcript_41868/g.87501 Transcript_41868/m.87501 type:complete len:192 (-) Transcript_41868:9-584(-)|eukprot:CAMPEP_0172199242 /NCGR_PEP_ID=MMETSP1050-20130122/28569_1 /TAXON_ID=233186 /ORGANISM="Cryptomonas curvata, Strain CCAP979/52" /LENGTH=191 /DNA_ID=CAMNT_0012876223 /DNA_START=292 /DNA_END=867 /DNA_ORIENTATION=-
MRIHEQKALYSPKFARVGISIVVIAALAITGISYSRRRDADLKPHQMTGTFNGGAARRSMPNLLDQDSLGVRSVSVSISDPLIVQAEAAIRTAFNIERNKTCASKNLYAQGGVQYARKAMASNGTVIYTLEVNYDDEVVFARVGMLPVGTRFQLISSIPGPCDGGPQDQLAVSALGTLNYLSVLKEKLVYT